MRHPVLLNDEKPLTCFRVEVVEFGDEFGGLDVVYVVMSGAEAGHYSRPLTVDEVHARCHALAYNINVIIKSAFKRVCYI